MTAKSDYIDYRKDVEIDHSKFALDFDNIQDLGDGALKQINLTYDGAPVKCISPWQKCLGLQDAYGDDPTKKNITLVFSFNNSDETIQTHLETLKYLDEFIPEEIAKKDNMKKIFSKATLKKVESSDIAKGYNSMLRQIIDKETGEVSDESPYFARSRLVYKKDEDGTVPCTAS